MSTAPPFSLHSDARSCVKLLPLLSSAGRVSIVPWRINILSWCSRFIFSLFLKNIQSVWSWLDPKKYLIYFSLTTTDSAPLVTVLQQSRVIVIFWVFILLSSTLMLWMLDAMLHTPVPRTHSPAEFWAVHESSSPSESLFSSAKTLALSVPWPNFNGRVYRFPILDTYVVHIFYLNSESEFSQTPFAYNLEGFFLSLRGRFLNSW